MSNRDECAGVCVSTNGTAPMFVELWHGAAARVDLVKELYVRKSDNGYQPMYETINGDPYLGEITDEENARNIVSEAVRQLNRARGM